jgi:NAD(P)H-dependent flavin oxidoreductase YrpB (nitropropane dioxygenase family)
MLAGMAGAAGPELAAAVTNAGGLGNIGGVGFSPDTLRKTIKMLKDDLDDKSAPFGVDLLLPQVGGNARKTNKDYTGGTLPQLIDIIIEEKAALFVCAVGVPPKWAVDKLHAAKIPVMNMIGAVKHVEKCLEVGVDIICAQGGEGGGHTGDIPTSILLPQVVKAVQGKKSSLTGDAVLVVGAGGICDGRSLAAALSSGCSGVWVGTRFIASEEAGAGPIHKKRVIEADYGDTVRTIVYTGRPCRVFKTPYIEEFEEKRQDEIREMSEAGLPAWVKDVDPDIFVGANPASVGTLQLSPVLTRDEVANNVELSSHEKHLRGVFLTGQCAGAITEIKPAKDIIDEMVQGAVEQIRQANSFVASRM